jgi:hypothetical protein
MSAHEYRSQTVTARVVLGEFAAELVAVGSLDGEVAHWSQRLFDVVAARGPMIGFFDWERVGTYDSSFRLRWQLWLDRQRSVVRAAHFLTAIRSLRMGVTVANLVVPTVEFVLHDRRASYVHERARWIQ